MAPSFPSSISLTTTLSSTDQDLIRRLREGEATAFEHIYDAYYERLWRFAYTFVRTRALAQEIVQDVFLWLWATRDTLAVRATLEGFLYGAVRNRALKMVRHERVVEREQAGVADMSGDGKSDVSDAMHALEQRELVSRLVQTIAQLPERQRTAITLRWKHGMGYEEVGNILEISPQAARTLVLRVQATLRTILGRFS